MRLAEFLEMVREGLGLESIQEADRVVRVVVAALKENLPEDKEKIISDALPGELSDGWEDVAPLSDITDRTEMSIEMEAPGEKHETPTITDG